MNNKERDSIVESINSTLTKLHKGQVPKMRMRGMISHKNLEEEETFHQIKKLKIIKDTIRNESNDKSFLFEQCYPSKGNNQIPSSYSSLSLNNIKKIKKDYSIGSFPGITQNKNNDSAKVKKDGTYCPYCTHCNNMNNDTFNKYIYNINEAKNVILASCEFIINNSCLENLDKLFNLTDTDMLVLSEEDALELKKNKENRFIDMEQLLIAYQGKYNVLQKRNVYKIVSSYMNRLIDGKMELDDLISKDFINLLNEKMIAKGHLFDQLGDKIIFDPEVESLFDGKTKEVIAKLFKKKYLSSLKEIKAQNEHNYELTIKRYMILFIIFLQILAEMTVNCKDKALLLYKCFIHFYAEQDKKWLKVFDKMKEKVKYYKNLTKTILQQKNKNIEHIENLYEVLFKNALTKENLTYHKKVISDLMQLVNEKRETIYSLQSQLSILNSELHFWLYDYDVIKLDSNLREKIKSCNFKEMLNNVEDEMKHKNLKPSVMSLLLNSDIFLKLSGQRDYFYEQKKFYASENRRLADILNNKTMKKKNYKTLLKELKVKYDKTIINYENDILILKDKLLYSKTENSSQTDIDMYKFNSLLKNNDLITKHKRLTQNKIASIVERINYGCTKVQALSMQSLLNLIPDIYAQKIVNDNEREKINAPKMSFDEFFFKYMSDKFKLKKIIKKHSEETIYAVLKYCKKDLRIDSFKRFLGFENDKIYREVLDIYLILLQNLPVQFDKLFYDIDYMNYLMDTNYCFEIIYNRLGFYQILGSLKEIIIVNSNMYEQSKKESIALTNNKKKEYYFLNRLGEKSVLFFNDLLLESKNNIGEKNIDHFISNLQDSNMLFNLSKEECAEVIKANFEVINDMVQLDSFLEFFLIKTLFRIRVYDFLDFVYTAIYILFEAIEKKINTIFLEIGLKKELIYYKDFEDIIMKLLYNNELKWKLPSYFNMVCGSESRDFISKEELISFIMNNRDLLSLLITQKNNCFIPNAIDVSKRANVLSIKVLNT